MFRTRKLPLKLLPVLLLFAVASGCGARKPGVVPLDCVVTLDGQPVEKAVVMLMPADAQSNGLPASGITDHHGRLALTTDKIGPGVVAGAYQITVIKKETAGFLTDKFGLDAGVAPGGVKVTWVVPQRYSSPSTSGLTVEVKPDMEPLKLDLKSK